MTRGSRLTDKQRRFVEEYLVDLNGTQAAIRAGYPSQSARQVAAENLSKPYIAAAVDDALAARARRCDVTADRVLLELARVAYADVRHLFDRDGRLKVPAALDPTIVPAVISIEVVTRAVDEGEVEYVHKIKLAPKVEALKTLAQHLGLLKMHLTAASGTVLPVRIVDEHHDT